VAFRPQRGAAMVVVGDVAGRGRRKKVARLTSKGQGCDWLLPSGRLLPAPAATHVRRASASPPLTAPHTYYTTYTQCSHGSINCIPRCQRAQYDTTRCHEYHNTISQCRKTTHRFDLRHDLWQLRDAPSPHGHTSVLDTKTRGCGHRKPEGT
jgi:hypothetical protein